MYRVELDDDAELELTALSPHTRRNVKEVLRRLRRGPDSALDLQLSNYAGRGRARAGRRWRVVFDMGPGRLITVRRIRRRETAYAGIERTPGP